MDSSSSAQTIIGTGLPSNNSRNDSSLCFNAVMSTRNPMPPCSVTWSALSATESLSFGLARWGRAAPRTLATRFGFFCLTGRTFGIWRPTRILDRAMLSAKYLKKRYLDPALSLSPHREVNLSLTRHPRLHDRSKPAENGGVRRLIGTLPTDV